MDEAPAHDAQIPSAAEDLRHARHVPATPQTRSRSYQLAFADTEFLLRDELRPVRLQLELLKPELELIARRIESTIVVFGSARVLDPERVAHDLEAAELASAAHPEDAQLRAELAAARRRMEQARYYEEARDFARIVTAAGQQQGTRRFVVVTGGGPGIMEAANRGAHDAGGMSIGLNIVLPHEQAPNRYITPELCFQFHYFALRKMHFLMRARALVVFPGGYGTLDELFETLCLIQTGRKRRMPVLLFHRAWWQRLIDFAMLVEEGTIDGADLDLFRYVETAGEAWQVIAEHYGLAAANP
jgi:hypothetical protein